ncbi:YpzI family protein [Neobacillus muris]|nr:YpzI family protein [Neobacillus muris]
MGKDRQEKKQRESARAGKDRDQALHFSGSTKMSSPEEARDLNNGKYDM